jgi:FkbM family methyltransferase
LTTKPDAICFDIGANHGQFSMVISRWQRADRKRLFAFEPDPHNLQVLRKNLRMNSCSGVEIVGKP